MYYCCFSFKLEQGGNAGERLLDCTGKALKTEPLVTVGQLKSHLLKLVSKQWYDYDRETFGFIRMVRPTTLYTQLSAVWITYQMFTEIIAYKCI